VFNITKTHIILYNKRRTWLGFINDFDLKAGGIQLFQFLGLQHQIIGGTTELEGIPILVPRGRRRRGNGRPTCRDTDITRLIPRRQVVDAQNGTPKLSALVGTTATTSRRSWSAAHFGVRFAFLFGGFRRRKRGSLLLRHIEDCKKGLNALVG